MFNFYKKSMIFLLLLSVMFLFSACEGVDLSKVSDEDLERISNKAVVCNEPYIRVGANCCLDKDTNKICDVDEKETAPAPVPPPYAPTPGYTPPYTPPPAAGDPSPPDSEENEPSVCGSRPASETELIGSDCNTGKVGICSSGIYDCMNNQVVCVPYYEPQAENCNWEDDNCNGQIDENLGPKCQNGYWADDYKEEPVEPEPAEDDSCDELSEDELSKIGYDCQTQFMGVCARGKYACSDGSITCQPQTKPGANKEMCDGLDNDCDGQWDEGNPEGGSQCTTSQGTMGLTKCQNGYVACV